MHKSRARSITFSAVMILLAGFIVLGGFNGGLLKASAASGLPVGNKQNAATATLMSVTGTPTRVTETLTSGSKAIIIPVTGTSNIVLASQILGFKVILRPGSILSPTTSPGAPSTTTTVVPPANATRTVSPTLASEASTPTVAATKAQAQSLTTTPTRSLTQNLTPTSPAVSGSTTRTPSETQVTSSSNDMQIGTVVDILVINPMQFSVGIVGQPTLGVTPRSPQATVIPPASETATVNSPSSVTSTPMAPAATSTASTSSTTSTPPVDRTPTTTTSGSSSSSAVVSPTQSRTPASGLATVSPMNTAVVNSQIVFVIVRLDGKDANFSQESSQNLVAIPWDRIQVMPSDNEILVNVSENSLRNFPFFGAADWNTLGNSGAISFWFQFWNLVPPSDLQSGSIPELGSLTSTPSVEVTQTAAGSLTQTPAP